jgi:hypothetical protein
MHDATLWWVAPFSVLATDASGLATLLAVVCYDLLKIAQTEALGAMPQYHRSRRDAASGPGNAFTAISHQNGLLPPWPGPAPRCETPTVR